MSSLEPMQGIFCAPPQVCIFPYDPAWETAFKTEAEILRSATGDSDYFIDHVGSTSIPGMSSKPAIDILLSVCDWARVDEIVKGVEALGYSVEEFCHDIPRYFLVKEQPGASFRFHLHICKTNEKWGRDMLVFRDELSVDSDVARKYVELKFVLAERYSNDLDKYTDGKASFIKSVLLRAANSFSVDCLLTHQRKELDGAKNLQMKMIVAQLLMSAIAAATVYISDNKYLLHAAGVGLLLMLLWVHYSQRQQKFRGAGDQARRVVLLISGLNKIPPAGQKLRIKDSFTFSVSGMPTSREEDHFASRESHGYKRLSEMIEESAYWTHDLQRFSARFMGFIFFVLAFATLLLCWYAVTTAAPKDFVNLSRTLIAFFVFLMSSDFLGLLLSYKNSADSIEEIFRRVESVAARGYKENDALLLMVDYNAAIEKSLPALPGAFKYRRKSLSQRWRTYIETKHISS
ncbi:TPA: GrpB family protein [Pseudomonas aeruginosa]|nr:GrpB family protein [Pseudomonas aeruginosa]